MAKLYDDLSVSFYSQLQWYYKTNKGIIRRRYRDLSLKFLNYNSKKVNENAFLRKPHIEALEMYIFLKEFLHNPQVSDHCLNNGLKEKVFLLDSNIKFHFTQFT